MNRIQRLILSAAAALVLLMLLFPPFHYVWNGNSHNLGYGFILMPPMWGSRPGSVNIAMLLIQWAGIAVAATVAVVVTHAGGRRGA